MGTMRLLSCVLAGFLTCLMVEGAVGQEYERKSLAGLRGVAVVIENIGAEFERRGLSAAALKTDVELKLRQAGIRVLSRAERLATPGSPYLYVNLNLLRNSTGLVAYSLRVALVQLVRLDRDEPVKVLASTWDEASVGTVGMSNLASVRRSMRDYVDRFINAYLAVNPG